MEQKQKRNVHSLFYNHLQQKHITLSFCLHTFLFFIFNVDLQITRVLLYLTINLVDLVKYIRRPTYCIISDILTPKHHTQCFINLYIAVNQTQRPDISEH